MFIEIPREDSAFALKICCLELEFTVRHELGDHALYPADDHKNQYF